MAGKVARFTPSVNVTISAFGSHVSSGQNSSASFSVPSSRPGPSLPPNGVQLHSGARHFQNSGTRFNSAQRICLEIWGRFQSFCRELFTPSRFSHHLQSPPSGLKGQNLSADEISYFASGAEAEAPSEHWRSLRRPDVIWEFLDREADKRFEDNGLNLDGPCLVICANLTCGRRLARHFTSQGEEAHLVTDVDEAFGVLKGRPETWSMAILDLDSFGGILELSDDLMDLRVEAPEVPVLLLSSGFSQDDLSEERLPMCDASIRSPAPSRSIAQGAKAAMENNKSWRLRYKGMIH